MIEAAARMRAERINIQIINGLARRRSRIGEGMGERAPAGAARAPAALIEITGEVVEIRRIDGEDRATVVRGAIVTRPGFKTARRRLPPVLARLSKRDARRLAAECYAIAVEKVGSIAGASAEGAKTDGGAATNDGGATTRIGHAVTIRAIEAALDKVNPPLEPRAQGGGSPRRAITARAPMDAVCLYGIGMREVLHRAGWSGQGRDALALNYAAGVYLDDMARALGFVDPKSARREIEEEPEKAEFVT